MELLCCPFAFHDVIRVVYPFCPCGFWCYKLIYLKAKGPEGPRLVIRLEFSHSGDQTGR